MIKFTLKDNQFDLFEHPEMIPGSVEKILSEYIESQVSINQYRLIKSQLEKIGYTCNLGSSFELMELMETSTENQITQIRSEINLIGSRNNIHVRYLAKHKTIRFEETISVSDLDQIAELDFVNEIFWIDPDGNFSLPFRPSKEMDLIIHGFMIVTDK